MNFQLSILPIIIQPKEDELFSSWLFRLATGNLTKAHTFCRFHLPGHNIWNRDIDKLAPDVMIKRLSLLTEIPVETIFNLTLRSYEQQIFKKCNPNGHSRWLLTLGIFHRSWTGRGLQFCPKCLDNDKNPYFRKSWRLGLSVVCTKCQTALHDCCPKCNAPISFFRTDVGHKTSIAPNPITACFDCGFDLRKSPKYPPAIGSTSFQLKLNKVISTGQWKNQIPSKEYFTVLYKIITILRSNSRLFTSLTQFIFETENQRIKQLPKNQYFETTPCQDREVLIRIGCWLLEQWPDRFISICKETKTGASAVLRDIVDPPDWFNAKTLIALHAPSAIELNATRKKLT